MTAIADIPRTAREEQVLLRLLKGTSVHPRRGEEVRSSSLRGATADGGWSAEHLLRLAARHRVLPQLYAGVRQSCPDLLPPEPMDQLRAYAQANTGKALRLAGELRRLADQFEQARIPVIGFKGIVLSARVYGDISLRDVGDLDLLVRRNDIVRAADLLVSLGHRPFFPTAAAKETAYLESLAGKRRERYLLSHCEHHLVYQPTSLNVDLHWAMSLREFSVSLDIEGIWNRAVLARIAGREVLTLGDEDLLIVLCLNGAKDCWDRLDRVCDVARLLVTSADALNWPLVLSHARQAGVARMLRVGLHLASTLLDAPLPDPALGFVEEDPHVRRICNAVTRTLLNPEPAERTAPARAAFDLRLRERWSERFSYCAAHLRPGVGDWAAVPLPDSLHCLYYLIRPFRLLFRHLRPT
jgi:putative nucleotidyltransferase-like protein